MKNTILFSRTYSYRKQTVGLLMVFLMAAVVLSSCEEEDGNGLNEADRTPMLENYADNLIIPAYTAFKQQADELQAAADQFANAPDTSALAALQNEYLATYRLWQKVEMYEFGPAADELLRSSVNTFPTDTFTINSNIGQGNYNLASASNIDAKGLPAIDYLLFGLGADNTAIVEAYTTGANAANRLQYLQDVIAEIATKANNVLNAWTGGYRNDFVDNDGTDIGSSTGLFVNQFNFEFELVNDAKLAIPLGIKSFGQPLPEKVEAFYSGIPAELADINTQNILDVFEGRHFNGTQTGASLSTYLNDIGAQYNEDQTLSEAIINQMGEAVSALENVPDPMNETIINDPSVVQSAYDENQMTIVLIKTDMTSAMGIQITYQDNDGD